MEKKGKIKIAYVEWACARASTNVVKAVLQEKLGYDVNILSVSAAAMWQAVGSGDADAMVTAWLPGTHKEYLAAVQDKVEVLGPLSYGAKVGWVVPAYVTINSIEELKANGDKFNHKIIGIDPGAGLMSASEKAIVDYGLEDWKLVEGSGATMTAALSDAIKNNEWIVVTGWAPHWKFGRWDLKFLEDPKVSLGPEEQIETVVRKGLKEDMPEAYAFLDNFNWTGSQMATVMDWNEADGSDPYETAKRYIEENPDQVKEWLGQK
ncbi:MAG: glycine betaine ABC transporter substrate-binding protein [Desulfatibacillum sp.]|nr:glycine betaine ABC transporter substrate-binding protein [Desulfatibacillum sp.]